MSELAGFVYVSVPQEGMKEFYELALRVFADDQEGQGLKIPDYNRRVLSVAAKTEDGTIVGGLVANTAWNELRIVSVAVNPACRVPGTGTALMRHAETVARTQLGCSRICAEVHDWQPRGFFERFGLRTYGVLDGFPRGHQRCFMEKVWPAKTSGEPVTGYEKAAVGLTMEEWEESAAVPQLQQWCDADAQARATPPVPPLVATEITFKLLNADGSTAAASTSMVVWNELHAHIIAVLPGQQRRGVGTTVLRKLEELAREHGCDHIMLETMTWQARPFYEKNGFEWFATQENLPPGQSRYRMVKFLEKPVPMNKSQSSASPPVTVNHHI